MGEDTSYDIKNRNLIDRLDGVPKEQRTARFVCAIACAMPDGRILTSRGTMEGIIGYESRGANGFGYDPIFYLPEYGCSSAELTPEQKNEVSHRGKALREMKDKLAKEQQREMRDKLTQEEQHEMRDKLAQEQQREMRDKLAQEER